MCKHPLIMGLAGCAILALIGCTRGVSAPAKIQSATADDLRSQMIRVLQATGPHPSLGNQANVFGRFVGTWDVDYGQFSEDGKKETHFPGELIVGWVMDGHVVQDLFISYPTATQKERGMGTTLRYFDSKSAKWHIVYVEPPTNSVVTLTGGQEGDRIVLYGEEKGTKLRWSFNDITDNSFTWHGEKSRDGGKTWWLQEEHHMKRRAPKS